MTRRQRRALLVLSVLLVVALISTLLLQLFQRNLMYFHSPTEVVNGAVPEGARFRLGGLVVRGSVTRAGDSLEVAFRLADCEHNVPVQYEGILPDLFREGQGIVVTGRLLGGTVAADEVLAKHDENYMPPELAESLQTEGGHSCAPFRSLEGSS